MTTYYVKLRDNPDLWQAVKDLWPGYRKQKVTVVVTDGMTPNGSYWDGGSRDLYNEGMFRGGRVYGVRPIRVSTAPPQFGGKAKEDRVELTDGKLVANGGTFQGKLVFLTVYMNQATASWLNMEGVKQ